MIAVRTIPIPELNFNVSKHFWFIRDIYCSLLSGCYRDLDHFSQNIFLINIIIQDLVIETKMGGCCFITIASQLRSVQKVTPVQMFSPITPRLRNGLES